MLHATLIAVCFSISMRRKRYDCLSAGLLPILASVTRWTTHVLARSVTLKSHVLGSVDDVNIIITHRSCATVIAGLVISS